MSVLDLVLQGKPRSGKTLAVSYMARGYVQGNFEPVSQIDCYIEGLNTFALE